MDNISSVANITENNPITSRESLPEKQSFVSNDIKNNENIINADYDTILVSMFDDSSINAEKSPFMTYPDDQQIFTEKTVYTDIAKTIQLYRNGDINDQMIRLLGIIIDHKYISSRQIWQMYLFKYGLYIKRDSLNKILNRMLARNLIVRFKICSSVGEYNSYIYCPEYNGIRLYSTITSENRNWRKTDSIQKSYIIKRSLANNQLLIAFLKHYVFEYKIQPRIEWRTQTGKEMAIVPSLQIIFKTGNKTNDVVLLVEVIRTYSGWKENFSEKLIRYGQYLKSIEDTQELRKYYIVVCVESIEHEKELVEYYYEIKHMQKISEIQTIKLYYIHDLALLDKCSDEEITNRLKCLEYSYDNKSWNKESLEEDFQKKDWHNIDFKVEKIESSGVSNPTMKFIPEDFDKEEISIRICRIMEMVNLSFPVAITKLSIPLRVNGVDYNNLGYRKLKNLFVDLSDYFMLTFSSSMETMVDVTEKLDSLIKAHGIFENVNEDIELYHSKTTQNDTSEQQNCSRSCDSILLDYFREGILSKRNWKRVLSNDIYCFKNWEYCVSLLTKMTSIYDINSNGWLNILSYSYALNKNDNKLLFNLNNDIMCYDTGLCSQHNLPIYMLSKLNYKKNPKWLLWGFATTQSKKFGYILKNEFCINDY